jgi:hypothetical protein
LPEYVLSNYINIDGKPRVSLINGPLVLVDLKNNIKAVIIIKGLVQKRVLLNNVYVANLSDAAQTESLKKPAKSKKLSDMIEGLIY